MPEIGSDLQGAEQRGQEPVGAERAACAVGEREQAVTKSDLPLQLACDVGKSLKPLGMRVGGFDQAADC